MRKIVVELYMDPELMGRFQKDPKAVLKEKGVALPEGVTLNVLVDTEKVKHIVLPYLGAEKIASAEEIDQRLSKIGLGVAVPAL
jgi:hypothetical protein